MKKLIVLIAAMLMSVNVYAGDTFVSYQSSLLMPEDDNFGYGKGFFAQGVEGGYSWKHVELGTEYYISNLETLHASTFTKHSVLGTVKLKYPLPWKQVNRLTPYAVIGVGSIFISNEDMKLDPDQIGNAANTPETIHNNPCLALKYGGGVQYKVTERISVFAEAAYRYADTGEPSSVDLYSWSYSLGVKTKF